MNELNDVILYTTGCPKCMVLESKLGNKNVEYKKEEDIDVMEKLGFSEAPMLSVNGKIMNFTEAVKFINNL